MFFSQSILSELLIESPEESPPLWRGRDEVGNQTRLVATQVALLKSLCWSQFVQPDYAAIKLSDNAFEHMYKLCFFDIAAPVGMKIRNMRTMLVVSITGFHGCPFLNEHKASQFVLILEQIVTDITFLVSRRFDEDRQVTTQFVFLACLGLQPDDDE